MRTKNKMLFSDMLCHLTGLLFGLGMCMTFAGCENWEQETVAVLATSDSRESISTEETAAAEPEWIYVHVAGAVNVPGLYPVIPGARLYEAIEAAGGFAPEAAQESVNLARVITDGEQIYVWKQEEYVPEPGGPEGAWNGRVNINTAGLQQLMSLPGIGQAKAQAIIEYREKEGAFQCPEDLMQVPGIKEAAFEKIKEYITVGS